MLVRLRCHVRRAALLLLLIGEVAWLVPPTHAADGGGTNVVTPTAVAQNTSGNTFAYTYTADAAKQSGDLQINVPSGWSAPQGSSGTAGYTTATSSGTVGDVKDGADSIGTWTDGYMKITLAADTGDKQEGSASLNATLTAGAAANDTFYNNREVANSWGTTQDATAKRVGMYVKSSVALSAGDFRWVDDDSANMASALDAINLPALSANTWTYTSVTLGAASRATLLGYGYRQVIDKGAMNFRADAMSELFDPAQATTNWAGGSANVTVALLGSGQEGAQALRCTYAAGATTNEKCRRSAAAGFAMGNLTDVSFWVRSSVATSATDLQFMIDNSAALGSPEDTVNLPALAANTWTYVVIRCPNSTGTTGRSYGINQVNDLGAFTLDLDAMGKQIDAGDSTLNWQSTTSIIDLSLEGDLKQQGTSSLEANITAAAAAGDKWYSNPSILPNWSSYNRAGFWIRSNVATTAGQLKFEIDDTANLVSPVVSVNVGALSANTWTYQSLALGSPPSGVASYGINYAADIGAARIDLDYLLLGPGSPTFSAGIGGSTNINVVFLDVASGGTVTVTYGSGGGASGVTTPNTAQVYTFSTSTRDSVTGTLTAIGTSPTIETNAQPSIVSWSDDPDPVAVNHPITFQGGWSDANAGESVKMFVCKTNSLISQATGGCSAGTWFASPGYTTNVLQSGDYTAQSADIITSPNSYFIFICDVKQVSNSCSSSVTGNFTAQNESITFSISANAVSFGSVNATASRYATTGGGSGSETEAHTLTVLTNAQNGYIVLVRGSTLTSPLGPTITAIGGTNTLPSPGSEQFGLRLTRTSGSGTVTAPYAASGFAYAADASTTSQVASGIQDSTPTVFSVRYLANVAQTTEAGSYVTTLTYVATATF